MAHSREHDHYSNNKHTKSYPHIARKNQCGSRQEAYPEICAEGYLSVSSERDIQIRLQPTRERNVPSLPEVAAILRFIRRIEVCRKAKAHHQRQTDSDVGITGKVRIDLQRIDEQCHKILETREQLWIVEHPVYEVYCKIITQYHLLEKTVENPEYGYAEHASTEEVLSVKLRDKIACLDDRSCHQLREEADIETKVKQIADWFNESLVHIAGVRNCLKGKERNTNRENNPVDRKQVSGGYIVSYLCHDIVNLKVRPKDGIDNVGKEISVLEIAENGQVDTYAQCQPATLCQTSIGPRDGFCDKEIAAGDKQKKADEQSAGFIIKQKAEHEQIEITHQRPVAHQGESDKDERKEHPEIQLGKQQRA